MERAPGTSSTTAVGIVSYNDPQLLMRSLDAIFATIPRDVPVIVYDDASWAANIHLLSQRSEARETVPYHLVDGELDAKLEGYYEPVIPRLSVIESPVNRGSAYGRTQLWRWAAGHNIERMATIDMDIRVHPGWLSTLEAVMDRHENCGLATFTYANDHGGRFPTVEDGEDLRVAETTSMCWLVRIAMLDDCLGPDQVWGMDARMEVFSHDSEFSQRVRRCSPWRIFMSRESLISEFSAHHSSQSSAPSLRTRAKERIDRDALVWAELEAARKWEVEKEKP